MKIDTRTAGAVLDVEGTLARFGGDQQLFHDIIGFFLEDTPPLLDELRRAVSVGNDVAVRATAHSLKGLAAGCGGVRAAQAAQRVENAGAEADLENIDTLMESLETEFDQLRQTALTHQL
jgi:HPt (histidine-containing phosphotransfer) domain-containing protein